MDSWKVLVWFAAGSGYVSKGKGMSQDAAMREARAYKSDAKGVKIRNEMGREIWIKRQTAM